MLALASEILFISLEIAGVYCSLPSLECCKDIMSDSNLLVNMIVVVVVILFIIEGSIVQVLLLQCNVIIYTFY